MSAPSGLLVVDKPEGPTSHDVVGRLRRLYATKRVGHAGTLDPMATGVLVALIGEATKLSTWLTLDDKAYVARVAFGRSTDTLDATGTTTDEAPNPAWLTAELAAASRGSLADAPRIAAAIDVERTRVSQIPPSYSAIQKDGVRAHAAARAGRALDLAPRAVVVRMITPCPTDAEGARHGATLGVELDVGKGYYVRAFARDLGETLGAPTCLEALRRTRSGPFTIATATALADLATMSRDERVARLVPIADVARLALECSTLTEEGLRKARLGQRLDASHFVSPPSAGGPFAWLDARGALVSVGEAREEAFAVLRNFDVGEELDTAAT